MKVADLLKINLSCIFHGFWLKISTGSFRVFFFLENFQCLCLLIIIQNAYHITANNRGFPHLRKSEAKFKVETRIRNKPWTDDQSLGEALRNYKRRGLQRKKC